MNEELKTRWEALYDFWSGFGWPAYDQYSVPDDASYPYITYESAAGEFGQLVPITASLWDHSKSWAKVNAKADEIEAYITRMPNPEIKGGRYRVFIDTDGGLKFAQSMDDPNDKDIRRKVLNVVFEFMIRL